MEQILKEEKLNMAMRMKEADGTSAATTVKRSSRFRGVSKHRWTGRYEAHLWDKLSWNVTQKKKGKQGAYDDEEAAARAYDLAALKYWGTSTFTNFPISDYEAEIEIMQAVTKEEYLASLRRKSSGFSRGVSKYRGVARHHHNGRWEARIGRVFGTSTQEEAARAYDIAAIEYRGINAITNFDLSTYIRWRKTLSTGLKRKAFSVEDLQETFVSKLPISPCSRSSPTALGLLLRSSVFRELVEKNSNVSEEETDGENNRNLIRVGSEDEYGGLFCDGSEDIPFAVSSGHSIELQEHHHFDYNPDTVGSNTIGIATIY
ncbi:Ethylene-responsive transcription factor WRI1 [Sesamum angolense]|uniref:Ethylene-responsive transcription factor WRI1 n=1 Tax=Sesamum angolense TaxID=2727404 RepID=A0AAE1WH69_9LAMI|nr:Ethylene-responsive transcription factor WRI1 [Sesamum angolense]